MRLSVQLYTLRDKLEIDVPGTLKQLKEIGLQTVEFAGLYGKTVEQWKSWLDEYGLEAISAHIGVGEIENDFDGVVNTAKTLGLKLVIIPWVGEDQYGAGWDVFAKKVEELGKKLNAVGLDIAYHNHAFEFVETNGKLGLDLFYETADPAIVKAELDLAWVHIGGGDPIAWVKKTSNRLPIIHVKNYDPAKDPQWVPTGEGKIDYSKVIPAAIEAGVQYAAIELDAYAGDPMDAVKASYDYLKSLGVS